MIGGFKPYPAYKDSGVSWLGEVPEHWQEVPGRAYVYEKQVPNIGMIESQVLSLSYGRIVVKTADKLHGLVPESFETYQLVDPGDIICRPTDLQNDRTSLRFGISDHRGIITSAYLCLRSKPGVNERYSHLLFHAYDLKKVFYGLGSGLRQNLDWKDFKYLPCLLPPVIEQTAIVRFLEHLDRRIRRYIQAKKKLIKLLEEQKQAIIHRAVTRGLDPDVRLKPSGIEWLGDVPEHWKPTRLKYVAGVQTGITLGKNYSYEAHVEKPYLRVANVQMGKLALEKVARIRLPLSDAQRATLRAGDVLMTEGGDIDKLGRGCLWNDEIPGCLHQNHVFAVRPSRQQLLPEFLVALMASQYGRSYFQKTAKQTTNLAATNSTTLGEFPIYIPDVAEQQRILDWVNMESNPIVSAEERALREMELLREYHTRLVADVVTGKLDVRDAAEKLPEDDDYPESSDASMVETDDEVEQAELEALED